MEAVDTGSPITVPVGAPPGYVGYEEGGQLTEAVRRRPYSVVLFDEIEKAHPDVFNILLQVLDDGRITDSQGRTVDFKNTILILTSNLGSQALLDGIDEHGEISEAAKDEVRAQLRRSFRPEFLNRLDEIVFYKPLTKENITGIIDLQIAALNKRLEDKQLHCELTPEAKQFIIDAAYDPQFGARPLRRYVQHTVETLLAKRILRGDVIPGQPLTCGVENGELVEASFRAASVTLIVSAPSRTTKPVMPLVGVKSVPPVCAIVTSIIVLRASANCAPVIRGPM